MSDSGLNYVERTKRLVESLEESLRTRFKASETAPILFTYGASKYSLRDRETRMFIIAAIQNDYYREHGEFNQRKLDAWYADCDIRASLNPPKNPTERPSPVPADSAIMDRLTNLVLYEELTDTERMKTRNTEYPFLSESQFDRRRSEEVPSKASEEYGVDRKNHGKPLRRFRTKRERKFLDQEAKIRNRARAARYRKFIGKQPVIEGSSEPFTQCIGSSERWCAYIGREEIEINKNKGVA